ncbi:MAG: hypothetical protein J3K34DRAFT_403405 [Monoraphidium minutum]|nr:MAG: hypothetical protein J3K34DRAFT_403405 [Monoraphidium minutum]
MPPRGIAPPRTLPRGRGNKGSLLLCVARCHGPWEQGCRRYEDVERRQRARRHRRWEGCRAGVRRAKARPRGRPGGIPTVGAGGAAALSMGARAVGPLLAGGRSDGMCRKVCARARRAALRAGRGAPPGRAGGAPAPDWESCLCFSASVLGGG